MESSSFASQIAQAERSEISEREFIRKLINLYRESPELWKVKSKDYFNRRKKSSAFERIVKSLKALKPDFTVDKLKQKINVLRTNFNREYKAIEKKLSSGTSTDDISGPSLWYYNDISFIKDQIETPKTETFELPYPDEDSQSSFASLSAVSPSSPGTPVPPFPAQSAFLSNKKRKLPADSTEQLVGLAIEYFKRPETEEDILAKSWALKLKKLRPDQRRFAEKIINDTLFEAEMGTLTRDDIFN